MKKKEKVIDRLEEMRKELYFCPAPTYHFQVGDEVCVGNLKDCVISGIFEDSKIYEIDYTKVERHGYQVEETPHCKIYFVWYHVRPIVDSSESSIKNREIDLYYSNRVLDDLLHKVLFFGVDFDTEYQRGLVWSDEDKVDLIDSIFNHINIGNFVFIHRDFEGLDKPNYEILDGKQRLTTIVDFYLNRFSYKGKYFNDLCSHDKHWFTNYSISVAEIGNVDRKTKLKYFLMLNTSGHVIDKSHLNQIQKLYDNA